MKLRFRSAQGLVYLCLAVALAGTVIEARLAISGAYKRETAEIMADTDRTAHQLAMRTAEVFDRVNQSTLLVKYMDQNLTRPPLTELVRSGVVAGDLLQSIYQADARGFIVETTSDTTALNVADEDFFKRHLRTADLDVEIAPVWVDPLNQRTGVPVTRRLERDGEFAGIVTATVEPAVLSTGYASFQAKDTVVGVLGADGLYRSRTVGGKLSFGERVDPKRLIERTAQARITGLPGKSSVDGVERFAAIVKVDRFPLYAVVAVDANAALASYRQERDKILTWACFAAVGAVAASGFLLRMARRLDESREKTRRAEAAFRATLDGSLDAVLILQAVRQPGTGRLLDLTIIDCNAQAAALGATTRERVLGRQFGEVMPSVRSGTFLQHFDAVLTTRRPVQAELQATDAPIAGRWLHHQIVPLDDGVALITRDVTDKHQAQAALEALSRVDGLTSLLNRRGFDQKLVEAMARAARSRQTLALLYLDLDGFKRINDTMGHAAGDAVLTEVGRRLTAAVRTTDTVSRLGGDEFTVILEGAGAPDDVADLCQRLLQTLQAPHRIEEALVEATPSIGVALMWAGEDAAALCARADAAMYLAKQSGKARFEWAGDVARADSAASVVARNVVSLAEC